jgi:putative ABC transport system ATP-binding protein
MSHSISEISGNAVSCRRVKKDFGQGENRALVLRGVDFDVRFGEMTLLVGPSGCGKTTLLSVIAGLLDATDGEISVLGQDMQDLSGTDSVLFRRKNLGFVFQQYNLLPALTGRVGPGAAPPRAALAAFRRSTTARRAGSRTGA